MNQGKLSHDFTVPSSVFSKQSFSLYSLDVGARAFGLGPWCDSCPSFDFTVPSSVFRPNPTEEEEEEEELPLFFFFLCPAKPSRAEPSD